MLKDDTVTKDQLGDFICFENYDQVPGFVVSQTAYTIRKTIARRFKKQRIDLTPHEFALLNRLAIHQKLNQKQLAEMTYKDRPAVTRMLHRLIDRGFVEKEVNQRDRRAFLVTLTATGKKVRNLAVPIAQGVLVEGLKGVSREDLLVTLATLKQITANIK